MSRLFFTTLAADGSRVAPRKVEVHQLVFSGGPEHVVLEQEDQEIEMHRRDLRAFAQRLLEWADEMDAKDRELELSRLGVAVLRAPDSAW